MEWLIYTVLGIILLAWIISIVGAMINGDIPDYYMPNRELKVGDKEHWEREAKKCKDNPYYFYTNYVVTIDEDGNETPATTNLSEKEFNEMVENYTWE